MELPITTLTLLRLCKLTIHGGNQWALGEFTNDPRLDDIDAGLCKTMQDGNIKIPGFCPTIYVKDVDENNDIVVVCNCGHDEETKKVKAKKLTWNLEQVRKFLDYVEAKGIEPC